MNRCAFCGGRIELRRIEHVHRWRERLCILRNVPAAVCTQCGEVFFAPGQLRAMDQAVEREIDPKEHLSVPVYTL